MATPHTAFFEQVARAAPSRADALGRMNAIATLLDTAFVIPGTKIRFGLDALIGLVPGIGDLASTLLSSYIVWEARRLGLPRWKIARMVANVVIDGAIGVVPVVGDAADVLFKANRRNMRIVTDHIEAEERRRKGVIDADFRVVERGR